MKSDPSPSLLGMRGKVVLGLALAGLLSCLALDLSFSSLLPGRGGREIVTRFFLSALSPAVSYESTEVPPDSPPLLLQAFHGARRTVVFAAAAMSLALVLGILLGFPASTAWWGGEPRRGFRRAGLWTLYGMARALLGFLRSIHELLWAVLFLAAFGFNTFSAVLAIALPYGGTLAKIFSEMIDEADRNAGYALRAAGASPLQVFFFGLLPRALPDMSAYAFYRFECAVRSSAILGFFGYETLGYYIHSSFQNNLYGEVWTYLYALFALVLLIDAWSGALRKRFVA